MSFTCAACAYTTPYRGNLTQHNFSNKHRLVVQEFTNHVNKIEKKTIEKKIEKKTIEKKIIGKKIEKKTILQKAKRPYISSTVKRLVWNKYIGEQFGKSKCTCCKLSDITQLSFHCGHIISHFHGGGATVQNMKPICQNCNSSMGTKNMNEFKKTLR
jgi:5-methylcytosine-specific restriction endonuclease McrA